MLSSFMLNKFKEKVTQTTADDLKYLIAANGKQLKLLKNMSELYLFRT